MKTYKIPDSLASKYHGAGHALAAVLNDQLIDIVYLEDVLPNNDPDTPHSAFKAINDPKLAPTVRQLQSLGQISFGMCSCWEFVEL